MPWDIYVPPVKKVEHPAPVQPVEDAPKSDKKKKPGREE